MSHYRYIPKIWFIRLAISESILTLINLWSKSTIRSRMPLCICSLSSYFLGNLQCIRPCALGGEFRKQWDDILTLKKLTIFGSDPWLEYCELTPHFCSIPISIRNRAGYIHTPQWIKKIPTIGAVYPASRLPLSHLITVPLFTQFSLPLLLLERPGQILFSRICIPGSPSPTFLLLSKHVLFYFESHGLKE